MSRRRADLFSKLRRVLYRDARVLGDVDAVVHPRKAPRRLTNKRIGRKVIGRLWR